MIVLNDKTLMCRIIRKEGSCPVCGCSRFLVFHSQCDVYLTNTDGEVIKDKSIRDEAKGICCNCNAKLIFLPTNTGFKALSPMEVLLLKETDKIDNDIDEIYNIPNPMNPK